MGMLRHFRRAVAKAANGNEEAMAEAVRLATFIENRCPTKPSGAHFQRHQVAFTLCLMRRDIRVARVRKARESGELGNSKMLNAKYRERPSAAEWRLVGKTFEEYAK